MLELILRVTRDGSQVKLNSEDGAISYYRYPSPDELEALGEDDQMYAVYQHRDVFSRRITPKTEW